MTEPRTHEPRSGVTYVPVVRGVIDFYFYQAWPLLEPAVARNGLYTQESIAAALKAGEMQLWVAERGERIVMALVTEIAFYPAHKVCTLVFIGGDDLLSCMPILADITQWAKGCGCDQMRVDGRRGWVRALPGFKEMNTTVVRNLSDG